jgi:hypothetical protein
MRVPAHPDLKQTIAAQALAAETANMPAPIAAHARDLLRVTISETLLRVFPATNDTRRSMSRGQRTPHRRQKEFQTPQRSRDAAPSLC